MSYETVLAGLHERFATVAGIKAILAYEPTAIHDYPMLYSLLEGAESVRSGQVRGWRYRIMHRLVFRWVDSAGAAAELAPFVNSVPAAVDADPHLGGRLVSGFAEIDDIEVNWIRVSGTDCLALDFYSTTIEK